MLTFFFFFKSCFGRSREQSEASRSWKNESFKKNEQDNEYIMCHPTLHLFIIFI